MSDKKFSKAGNELARYADELLKRTRDKLYTDFVIFTPEDRDKTFKDEDRKSSMIYKEVWETIDEGIKSFRSLDAASNRTFREGQACGKNQLVGLSISSKWLKMFCNGKYPFTKNVQVKNVFG